MSTIGYTSGQIEHKEQLLDAVNRAVLTLHIDALGLRMSMHIDERAVIESRTVAERFAHALEGGLEGKTLDPAIAALVTRMATVGLTHDYWAEHLRTLRSALSQKDPLGTSSLAFLSELLALVDRDFIEDLRRLHGRVSGA